MSRRRWVKPSTNLAAVIPASGDPVSTAVRDRQGFGFAIFLTEYWVPAFAGMTTERSSVLASPGADEG
jgi:hypothetical protein